MSVKFILEVKNTTRVADCNPVGLIEGWIIWVTTYFYLTGLNKKWLQPIWVAVRRVKTHFIQSRICVCTSLSYKLVPKLIDKRYGYSTVTLREGKNRLINSIYITNQKHHIIFEFFKYENLFKITVEYLSVWSDSLKGFFVDFQYFFRLLDLFWVKFGPFLLIFTGKKGTTIAN